MMRFWPFSKMKSAGAILPVEPVDSDAEALHDTELAELESKHDLAVFDAPTAERLLEAGVPAVDNAAFEGPHALAKAPLSTPEGSNPAEPEVLLMSHRAVENVVLNQDHSSTQPEHSAIDPLLVTVPAEVLAEEGTDGTATESGELPSGAALTSPEIPSTQAAQPRPVRFAALREKLKSRLGANAQDRIATLPVRVIIGYLPEVSERDASEYAQGMAEKHFEQMGISYFNAFAYANGFAFEAHEGGDGRAFLPHVLEFFDAQGPYKLGEIHSVVIRTATRLVEVQRMRDGLASIILPESATTAPTAWLKPSKVMIPGLNRRTAFFYSGIGVFATGALAMLLCGSIFRLQPFQDVPPTRVENISANNLPRSQWSRIEALPPNSYVKAIRFRNDKWEAPEIVTETPSAPSTAAVAGAAAAADAAKAATPATQSDAVTAPTKSLGTKP